MPARRTMRCIGDTCRDAFVPHAGNAYRPHALHPKRTLAYGALAAAAQLLLIGVVAALPSGIFATTEATDALRRAIAARTNAVRLDARVDPLAREERLERSGTAKARDMARRAYFGHRSPDGRGPEAFLKAVGYPYAVAGENLAMGFTDATAVITAWRRSPTHYRNLIDVAFTDIGVGVASGTYRGSPTVYIAQHFGHPADQSDITLTAPLPTPLTPVALATSTTPAPTLLPGILGTTVTTTATPTPLVDASRSIVRWTERDGTTVVEADVAIRGPIVNAVVDVNGRELALSPVVGSPDRYAGALVIPDAPQRLFRAVTLPGITVERIDGSRAYATLAWDRLPVQAPTLADRFRWAASFLPETIGPLRAAMRVIALAALILFGLAWLVNLLVEVRRQHLDLVLPGAALLVLLATVALL